MGLKEDKKGGGVMQTTLGRTTEKKTKTNEQTNEQIAGSILHGCNNDKIQLSAARATITQMQQAMQQGSSTAQLTK
jgi:hypothetical protein